MLGRLQMHCDIWDGKQSIPISGLSPYGRVRLERVKVISVLFSIISLDLGMELDE